VNDQRGFTLLEMLAVLAITALLVTSAVEIHIQIVRSLQERVEERGRDVTAQRVIDRIERELVSSQLVAKPEKLDRRKHPWVFQGSDGGIGQADTLRFITLNPGRSSESAGALRMVSYAGGSASDSRFDLFRLEQELPEALPEPLNRPDGTPALREVTQFQIRYLNKESGNWQDAWDSTQSDELPAAVEVTVQLAEAGSSEPTPEGAFTRVIPLPVRAIKDKSKEECTGGVTVSACADRIQASVAALPEEDQQLLGTLVETNGGACIIGDSLSKEVTSLRQLLSAAGIDVDQACAAQ
jgi:type II secretion system protein J